MIELEDRLWRLRNLYSCRVEGLGKPMKFTPRHEQEVIFKHLIETPEIPAYIIKSRRLGLSTGICTFNADAAVFEAGWRGVIIDQKQEDATKKMVEIIRFSIDNLDPAILRQINFDKRNDSELRFRVGDEPETKDSVIYATTGSRGGDTNLLHLSELGPIAATDARRSQEIRTGAFPAARMGRRVTETTWMGGKGGDLWEMVQPILERNPNAEGIVYFFPWHDDPVAVKVTGEVTKDVKEYFDDLEAQLGKNFSPEQKKWWAAKKLEQGIFMSREYPSTLEEAFRAPVEGAIFAKRMDQARSEGRIKPFPWDRGTPVHTVWDIGSDANTRVTYFQTVGGSINFIDHDHGQDEFESYAHRISFMKAKGYFFGNHFLPHDAASLKSGSKSYQDELIAAGLVGTIIIPKCHERWPGINKVHEILPRCSFHSEKCSHLIEAMDQYAVKKSNVDGHLTDVIVEGWQCHAVDTVRYVGEAMINGLLPGNAEVVRSNRPASKLQTKAKAGKYRG